MTRAVVVWDWKEQPDLVELAEAIRGVSDGQVWLYEVDTGSDEFAIVLSTGELTDDQVREEYLRSRSHP